jgi:hypothetical protein
LPTTRSFSKPDEVRAGRDLDLERILGRLGLVDGGLGQGFAVDADGHERPSAARRAAERPGDDFIRAGLLEADVVADLAVGPDAPRPLLHAADRVDGGLFGLDREGGGGAGEGE